MTYIQANTTNVKSSEAEPVKSSVSLEQKIVDILAKNNIEGQKVLDLSKKMVLRQAQHDSHKETIGNLQHTLDNLPKEGHWGKLGSEEHSRNKKIYNEAHGLVQQAQNANVAQIKALADLDIFLDMEIKRKLRKNDKDDNSVNDKSQAVIKELKKFSADNRQNILDSYKNKQFSIDK